MKIVVIGDSHGNVANIKLAMGFAKKIKAGAIIHCGDWDNLQSVKTVYSYKIPVYGVLGNADVDEQITKNLKLKAKKFNKKFLRLKLDGRIIGVVHNILVSSKLSVVSCDIVFCGHRHFKSERIVGGVKVVAPGALHSIKPSFAVYDTEIKGVEFFDL